MTVTKLPPEQAAIRAKCFHPTGTFIEFKKEEIEQSISDRFEKMVRQFPDRIAVKKNDHVVTYADLNAMANRVARSILEQRGGASEPVGLLFDNGAPLIAAALGILKAGKFVLLLDPSFPKARLLAVLRDAQAGLVVTDRKNASFVREAAGSYGQLMEIEAIKTGISTDDIGLAVAPTGLAFLLYTSGSTGNPKGLKQDHRSRLHRIMAMTNMYHICEHDSVSLFSSGTSSAVGTSLLALLNGAALLPFDVRKQGIIRLASWLTKERISIVIISSPLFRSLCDSLSGEERFPDVRMIRLSSEAVYKTDFALYKKFFPSSCRLATGLAPSEAGLLTHYLMDHDSEISGSEVPIGYAVADKEISLLDDDGREVKYNQLGEIVVRSKFLSSGYWRQPELTESKFKLDPEGGDNHLYFTGDLGLMRPDGCLIFKGRKDFRVKIRGYGVEIAEVEKVLRAHPTIKEIVVVARPSESGEARLIAYFTCCGQSRPTVSELRRYMKEQLSEYMIPSAFVCLQSMPLTANGKIDRRALPDPANTRPQLGTPFVDSRSPTEEELVKIWALVLGLDQVGIHDNFFDLGGHSLAATRVVTQVIKTFQLELPLNSLFRAPTVAEMAVVIKEHQAKKLEQNDLDRILTELEALSEADAQRVLATIMQNAAS